MDWSISLSPLVLNVDLYSSLLQLCIRLIFLERLRLLAARNGPHAPPRTSAVLFPSAGVCLDHAKLFWFVRYKSTARRNGSTTHSDHSSQTAAAIIPSLFDT
ncbi:hypothetical protein PM082_020251 [Marasmius tenuissimus]|nr:hypothetical protein PM082_020251 [Marasmius tenuissimus]